MENINTKQEILLLTNSSFAQRELCENGFFAGNTGAVTSHEEKLEEACWNGLLEEWLNDALVSKRDDEKIFLWKIHIADMFLCVELSKAPYPVSCFHSLDPYLFLPLKNNN